MLLPKPTVTFFLDRSRPSSDGTCLIKLNIYFKPDKKRYATTFRVTDDDWEKLNGKNLRDAELKKTRASLNALKHEAEKVIEKIQPFSFTLFEEVFLSKTTKADGKGNSIKSWFDDYIRELKQNDQVGTAKSYTDTYNSIASYKANLLLQDITPKFLKGYEQYMLSMGRSPSTIGIYLRQLRAIINQAIADKVIQMEAYPFAGYVIPTARNIKKALSNGDLKKLLKYKSHNVDNQKALDFWILSYLCSGINFADIVELKPTNIHGNMLVFHRVKTKRTKKKDLRPIRVGLPPEALKLIKKYRNKDASNPYLFPVLEAGLTASTIKYRTQAFTKWTNDRVKGIAKDLGIELKVTTYAARHSFSTVLKRKGVPTAFIKDSLGHSSVATTEDYLDSFPDDQMVSVSNMLTKL